MLILKTIVGVVFFICIILVAVLAILLFDILVKKLVTLTKKYPIVEIFRVFIVNAFLVLLVIFVLYILMSFCYQIGDKII